MTTCMPTTTGSPAWAAGACQRSSSRPVLTPVLIKPPAGEAAVRLWRLLTGWLEFSALYEVQRPKRPADLRDIAETFQPYLEARDWISIQKGTP